MACFGLIRAVLVLAKVAKKNRDYISYSVRTYPPNPSPVAPAVPVFVRVLSPLQKYRKFRVTVDWSSCRTRGVCYVRMNRVQAN
eukprot:14775244-Ditylum_brightwellii.AAC.1